MASTTQPGGNGTDTLPNLPDGIDASNATQHDLPEGVAPSAVTKGIGVNQNGESIQNLNLEKGIDGLSVTATKDTSLTGRKQKNMTVEAAPAKGETTAINADTHTKNSSITNTGKGALEANLTGGTHKDLTISSTKKKVADNVNISNGVTLKNSTMEVGKGNDNITFSKKVVFSGQHTIDLGKKGKDSIVFKADDVSGIDLTVTNFTKKDTIQVGDETFTWKDFNKGAEIPGITVELA
jgi:hypothetical protein